HEGELEAQRRFGAEGYWNDHNLGMIRDHLPSNRSANQEVQSIFCIATANDRWECDCCFRGREFYVSGQP
ncbi:MAG: hypothetical protein Q8L38_09545, partial [Pseudohongiella sp.]|nr:hypothetical protein [Pseudohongiella sp.]